MLYNVVRFYSSASKRVIRKSLSLEEAQAHCRDPETSSRTAKKRHGKDRTKRYGVWFDGYTSI